jgi:hypothetical protein
MGIGRYLCKVYKYHDTRACEYMWSRILPRIEGVELGMEWFWMWFVV